MYYRERYNRTMHVDAFIAKYHTKAHCGAFGWTPDV